MLRDLRRLKTKMGTDELNAWLYGAECAEEEEALFFVRNKNRAYTYNQ